MNEQALEMDLLLGETSAGVLNILRCDTRQKASLPKKRFRGLMNRAYRESLLSLT